LKVDRKKLQDVIRLKVHERVKAIETDSSITDAII